MMFKPDEGSVVTPDRPERFDVIVLGTEFGDWVDVLVGNSSIWDQAAASITSVAHQPDGWGGGALRDSGDTRRLIVPLLERNILVCPTPSWGLVPGGTAVRMLADKKRFASYLAANGLGDHLPGTYANADSAIFPCVLKRTNLYASFGVAVAHSRAELDHLLTLELWVGKPVIFQEYIEAPLDYTTHCVCVDGGIVWQCTYAFGIDPASPIRVPRAHDVPTPVKPRAMDLAIMADMIRPLRFDGPLNFNYRRRASGGIAMLEINPRFGGSLFRAAGHDDLRVALATLVKHAKWRP